MQKMDWNSKLPKLLAGEKLKEAMIDVPEYSDSIREADAATRLMALSDIYKIYFDTKPEVKISREHAQYKWVKIEAKELEKYKEKFAGESYSIIEEILDNLADDKAEY